MNSYKRHPMIALLAWSAIEYASSSRRRTLAFCDLRPSCVQELMNDIADASAASNQRLGAANEQTLLGELRRGLNCNGKRIKNVRRSLDNRLLKNTKWPGLYYQDVRCWCPQDDVEKKMPLAFILPHEVIGALVKYSDIDALLGTVSMDPLSKAHLSKCEAEAGCKLLGIGLWGDGVPCQWDRNE